MTYEDLMLAILENPEDDNPRIALAEHLRVSDPKRSEFIRLQVDMAIRRRTRPSNVGIATVGGRSFRENALENENRRRWSRDLDEYMGTLGIYRTVMFDRGLVFSCSMNPRAFLDEGEHIVSRIAPLRGVQFFTDRNDRTQTVPMAELATCPLLARFDWISFHDARLTEADLVTFATHARLDRCQRLTLGAISGESQEGYPEVFDLFAANPTIRKCLMIDGERGFLAADRGPIGEFYVSNPNEYSRRDMYVEMSEQGRGLERKYGYIPWLHLDNRVPCHAADIHYFVERKEFPLFVPGSPAEAPTRYGRGFGEPLMSGLAPRAAAEPYLSEGPAW